MSLQMTDVAHILVALTLLVVVAHTFGQLFRVLRQPPVIGEILGGLLLGPSLLGGLWPGWERHLFPHSGPTASLLGAVYQLGLIFMMFLAGGELRPPRARSERRTVVSVTIMGLLVPFSVGVAVAMLFNPAPLIGPSGSRATFVLVFAIAIAVTSIPVVSRILLDLGLLGTAFARIVLTVAVLEDLVLYVMLAVALGLAQSRSGASFGLWAVTGVKSVAWSAAYYVAASVIFLAVLLVGGRTVFRWLAGQRFNALERRNPTAFRLVFLFLVVLCCVALGINPVFGALMAGISVAQADDDASASPSRQTIQQFSLAFFVPVYFALVGLQLDIVHDFPVIFFLGFILLACVIKLAGVWAGARLSGEPPRMAVHLAVAMNARGGPGIVLATVTLTAGIINLRFFTVIVLLSILTSQAAGIWLDRKFPAPDKEARDEQTRTAEPEPVRRS